MALDIGDTPVSTSNTSNTQPLGVNGIGKVVIFNPNPVMFVMDFDGGDAPENITPFYLVDGGFSDGVAYPILNIDCGGAS